MKTKILNSAAIKDSMLSLVNAISSKADSEISPYVNKVVNILNNVLGQSISNVIFDKKACVFKFMCKGKYIRLSSETKKGENVLSCKYIK